MFNEQSVGRRVVSKTYGEGIVIHWDTEDDIFPVKVAFTFGYDDWYTSEGYASSNKEASDEDIVPYPTKQGSPDARRIVAMLAVRYRKAKQRQYAVIAAKLVYLKAKQLLAGESNERI